MIKKYLYYCFVFFMFCISINVYADNNVVENNYLDIKESLYVYDNIYVNLDIKSNELIAKRVILDLIKGSNKTITYNILDNNKVLYSFKFNGKYFSKSYNDINLKINNNSKKDNFINEYFEENKIILNTLYDGFFPDGTTLNVENNFNKSYIYFLENDRFIKIEKANKNNLDFIIKKGGVYVLSGIELINNNIILVAIKIIIMFIIEIMFLILIIYKKK